jgi:IMP dehydrogenase/GMP reductase
MFTNGYCFDDVLLIPKYSEIQSRDDVDLSVELPRGIKLQIPLVSANMKNVTGVKMAQAIKKLGGLAILHRFDLPDWIVSNFLACTDSPGTGIIGASIGIKDKDLYLAEKLYRLGCKVLCVDVAHGNHRSVKLFVQQVRSSCPDVCLIAGNIATEDGALLLWNAGADIIKIGIGPGCFAAGTRILMANGTYKNIEDVKAGDRIINKDGLPRNVLNSFSTGIRKVSKVRNSIFYKDTYVTHDHKYFVGDLDSVSNDTLRAQGYAKILGKPKKNGDSKFGWQEVGTQTAKCLLMPRNIKFELSNSFCHDICIRDGGNGHSSIKTKVDFSLEPSYNLGYVFGTFLGDGHAMIANNGQTDIGAVRWYFGLEEDNIAEKLLKAIKSITNRDLKINKKSNIIECILYHKPLAEFLSTFGKKKYKHLPEKFIVNNQSYLLGISDGLIDSDGNIEESGRVCLKNTSPQIIELFNVVTYLLSEVFPNNQKGEVSTGNLKDVNVENFNIPYVARINKTASKRLVDNFQASKLLEYTETDKEVEVFDLTIDCETHSFIADNAIVHNSICSTRIETGNGYPQLSALKNVCDGDYKPWGTSDDFTDTGPMFIADGGIKNAGDCVKALCFADLVMIGNLFAGTDEAPGQVISVNGQKFKEYAGSSTHKQKHIEGVIGLVPYKGPVGGVITKLVEGIRSGCSYQGVDQVRKLQIKPEFVVISNAGLRESHPHDVKL